MFLRLSNPSNSRNETHLPASDWMWPGPRPESLFRRRERFARFLCDHGSGKDKGRLLATSWKDFFFLFGLVSASHFALFQATAIRSSGSKAYIGHSARLGLIWVSGNPIKGK